MDRWPEECIPGIGQTISHYGITEKIGNAKICAPEQADANRFLGMNYLEGETLRARLTKRPLPIPEYLHLSVYFSTVATTVSAARKSGGFCKHD